MKVLVFILSVVCISSARYVKWTPNDVDGDREVREEIHEFHQFHQFWSQLGDLLWEKDEETVKQILQQVLEIHRPYHGDSSDEKYSHHGMDKPNRPYLYQHIPRPSYDEKYFDHGMAKPNRPYQYQHNTRPSYEDREEIMRPLPHEDIVDDESLPQMHIMRPLVDPMPQNPAEIDDEMENSVPQMHIMRPAEIDDEMENSVPQMHIMRPLHDHPVEIDELELEETLRTFEAASGDKVIERPEDFRPVKVQVDMDHVMRPSFAPSKVVFDAEDLYRPSIIPEDTE